MQILEKHFNYKERTTLNRMRKKPNSFKIVLIDVIFLYLPYFSQIYSNPCFICKLLSTISLYHIYFTLSMAKLLYVELDKYSKVCYTYMLLQK